MYPICINFSPLHRTKSRVDSDGTLVISTVSDTDAGVYRCTVSNGLGAPMSAEAHLSVICKSTLQSTLNPTECLCATLGTM
mgnify:FL=1